MRKKEKLEKKWLVRAKALVSRIASQEAIFAKKGKPFLAFLKKRDSLVIAREARLRKKRLPRR